MYPDFSFILFVYRFQVIREMEGTIQLKKYRTMRQRYGEGVDAEGEAERLAQVVVKALMKK